MTKDQATFRETVQDECVCFTLSGGEGCLKRLLPRVEAFAEAQGLDPRCAFQLQLVLDELITNVLSYGYIDKDEHEIEVRLKREGDVLTLKLVDSARPFDILTAPPPELDLPLEERARTVGGMGIHLVKNMVDEIAYERRDDRNILTLTKRIEKPGCCPDSKPQGGDG